MRYASALLVAGLALATSFPAGARAAAPAPAPQTQAPREDLTRWEWYQTLSFSATKGQLVSLTLPPAVLGHSARVQGADHLPTKGQGADYLADLRLTDSSGAPIPYALRVRRPINERIALKAREYNKVAGEGQASISLDLGENPREHDSVFVRTRGNNFRRAVRVEGSSDGTTWEGLVDRAWLVRYQTEAGPVVIDRLKYTVSRFRYLRITVRADKSQPDDEPAIEEVEVLYTATVPGEYMTANVSLQSREPVPAPGGPGSAWWIDLGERVPVEKLLLEVSDTEFVRPFLLEQVEQGESPRVLAQGEWRRQPAEGQRPLVIQFPETTARRLRLTVTDFRNPPLNVSLQAQYSAPVRQVIFPAPGPGELPVKLYVDNPKADPPNYDFAATLPAVLDPPPAQASSGSLERNPEYQPIPKPWTERMPWLVDVVLGAAGLVLLGILLALAREAIRRHDQEKPAEPAKA